MAGNYMAEKELAESFAVAFSGMETKWDNIKWHTDHACPVPHRNRGYGTAATGIS